MHIFSIQLAEVWGIGRCTLGVAGGRGTLQLYHPPHPMAKPDPMKTEYMHIFSIQLAGVWGEGRRVYPRGSWGQEYPSPPTTLLPPMPKPDPMKTEYMHIFSIQLAEVWGIGRCTLGVAGGRGTTPPPRPSPPCPSLT